MPWKLEKLRCIFHYFRRITEKSKEKIEKIEKKRFSFCEVPTGVMTFRRYQLPDTCRPKWSESNEPLCPIHITKNKTIEDLDGFLQVEKRSFSRFLIVLHRVFSGRFRE